MGVETMTKPTLVVVCATCDDCNTEFNSRNAFALIVKHCRKYGHNGQVSMEYAVWGRN